MWGYLLKSLLGAGLKGGLAGIDTLMSLFTGTMKSAWGAVTQYQEQGVEFSRRLGLNLKESQAYTNVLIDRASALGAKYGIAADKVFELQKNLSEATGRAAMLNNQDAEKLVQINKLVGSDTTDEFTKTIVNNLGGQIHSVEGAVSKAYATAAKSGLDAAKFSEKIAQNLSLANKLSFRNGVDGITKMTVLSEKLGFNLQSVAAAAENFMEIDKAIENSAKLQMLGGAAGAYGSNPLTMAYEANYDPEAFTERMTKTLGGLASFDAKTGMASVNGMNRDFVKNIAQTMGIRMDEAMSIAKKQAEVKYKESQFMPQLSSYGDEFKDFLTNRSYVGKDGKLKITDASGKERTVGGNGSDAITEGELKQMQQFTGMSDEEIMQQQALTLTNINEQIEGIKTSLSGEGARALTPALNNLQSTLRAITPNIINAFKPLFKSIGDITTWLSGFISDKKDWLKNIIDAIGSAGNWASNSLTTVGSIFAGALGLKGLTKFFSSDWWKGLRNAKSSGESNVDTPAQAAPRGATPEPAQPANTKKKKGSGNSKKGGNKHTSSYKQNKGRNLDDVRRENRQNQKPQVKPQKPTVQPQAPATQPATPTAQAKGSWGSRFKNFVKGGSKFGRFAKFGRFLKGGGVGLIGSLANSGVDMLVDNGIMERGGAAHATSKTLASAAEWGGTGAMVGSLFGPVGTLVGGAIGGLGGAAYGLYQSGIFNKKEEKKPTVIKPKPVGNKEHIARRNTQQQQAKQQPLTVKDFNVNVNGTIKLDAGKGNGLSIDVRELLKNSAFVSSIKDMIKTSINQDMNNGRIVNDISVNRGAVTSGSLNGKR